MRITTAATTSTTTLLLLLVLLEQYMVLFCRTVVVTASTLRTSGLTKCHLILCCIGAQVSGHTAGSRLVRWTRDVFPRVGGP
jgi:hypothetical protein